MIDPYVYGITVRRNNFEGDDCFEARVKEFPDLAEYADTFEEAYSLAIDAIETTAEIFGETGKKLPVPAEMIDDYSGRVTLRIPKGLHRSLSVRADDEGVSLNQYLVSALSSFHGFSAVLPKAINAPDWYQFDSAALFAGIHRRTSHVEERDKSTSRVKIVDFNKFNIEKRLASNL